MVELSSPQKPYSNFQSEFEPIQERKEVSFESWVYEYFTADAISLEETPPDPELIGEIGAANCARLGILPLKRMSSSTIVFIDNLAREEVVRTSLAYLKTNLIFLPMSRAELINALPLYAGEIMLEEAREYCPRGLSVRRLYSRHHKLIMSSIALAIIYLCWRFPSEALLFFMFTSMMLVLGNSVIRLGAIVRFLRIGRKEVEKPVECTLSDENLPVFSILLPLHREPQLIQQLIESVDATNYPHEKLDVKLVLEADDDMTIDAIKNYKLPIYVETILVPPDELRTKPKAMNYTLPFCHGEIIGIYDAEDKADPNQLREVAQTFHNSHMDVATVQCELCFYNSRQNWFTKCFSIEYRMWFSALLPALQYFNLAVPLGGTSVFFRKYHLKNVGAWDANNVTEDADLGIRFKRLGFETAVISSKTREEANGRPISWVRQRSRWLKGYMMTWAAHMSDPIHLYRDLGGRAFWAVQILCLGAFGSYLAIPLFWALWPVMFGYDFMGFKSLPEWFRVVFFVSMFLAQAVSLGIGLIALYRKEHRYLFKTWLTLPLYWPLGSIAAYKALFELIFFPYYWDKTEHGHGQEDKI